MKHATSRMLFAYWDAARGERASPERSEIEPGAIRHILADTFILEIGANGTAEFRLAERECALCSVANSKANPSSACGPPMRAKKRAARSRSLWTRLPAS